MEVLLKCERQGVDQNRFFVSSSCLGEATRLKLYIRILVVSSSNRYMWYNIWYTGSDGNETSQVEPLRQYFWVAIGSMVLVLSHLFLASISHCQSVLSTCCSQRYYLKKPFKTVTDSMFFLQPKSPISSQLPTLGATDPWSIGKNMDFGSKIRCAFNVFEKVAKSAFYCQMIGSK